MSKSISRFNHLLVLNNNNNKKDNRILYNIYYDQLALTLWQFSDCDAVRRMCTYNVHNITMSLNQARCPPPIVRTSGIRTARVYNNASLKYILRLLQVEHMTPCIHTYRVVYNIYATRYRFVSPDGSPLFRVDIGCRRRIIRSTNHTE